MMLKFRSMRPDAEKLTGIRARDRRRPAHHARRALPAQDAARRDSAVHQRAARQMSLVGPRPERPELAEQLAMAIPYFEERMRDVKPGITGLAQISLGYSGKPLPRQRAREVRGRPHEPVQGRRRRGRARRSHAHEAALRPRVQRRHRGPQGVPRPSRCAIILQTPLVMLRREGNLRRRPRPCGAADHDPLRAVDARAAGLHLLRLSRRRSASWRGCGPGARRAAPGATSAARGQHQRVPAGVQRRGASCAPR